MGTRVVHASTFGRVVLALALLASVSAVSLAVDSHLAAAETQAQAIVTAAVSQRGIPYCEGGGGIHGPSVGNANSKCAPGVVGYDCMSLAQYAVYQGTGITVPLPPDPSLPERGTFVPPDGSSTANIRPGDVVFFGGSSLGHYTHSGVYVGDNQVWDALEPGDTVQVHPFATVYSDYGNVYQGAVQYWTGSSSAFAITSTSPLPDGSVYRKTAHNRYSATLAATRGGNPPYKWSLVKGSGSLPPGLKLSSKGVISGKARRAGTYTFTVEVKDKKTKAKPHRQNKATERLSITIS